MCREDCVGKDERYNDERVKSFIKVQKNSSKQKKLEFLTSQSGLNFFICVLSTTNRMLLLILPSTLQYDFSLYPN